jgi:hypothetical protein
MTWIEKQWRKNFLPIEAGLSLVATVALGVWLHFDPSADAGGRALLKDNRPAVYAALSAIWGSLLGFGIAALSIAMAFSQDERMTVVRNSKYYETMWGGFTKNIFAMSLATLAALAALVVDKNDAPSSMLMVLVAGSSLFAIFRLANCIWLLEKLVAVILSKKGDAAAVPPPAAPVS